ncbi:type III polyketide synthase [Paenibacillus daejeonensis]|uniref:type III polyketide synthase n=1 Tax=Paenibacillus daejeonensis TaxID=135193 RepID=UPI00037576E0|nr:type III polyketide synthase [Paenibacillus daejeonensis]
MPTGTKGIAITGIGLALPEHQLEQHETSARLAEALAGQPDAARWARRVFRQNGVETRYTCEPNLLAEPAQCRYFPTTDKAAPAPTTSERMRIYKRESVPLALTAARTALLESGSLPSEITHLITVSCTGQFLPGLDAELTWQLGLKPAVQRLPLQFLGCGAGLKAIGLARQITASQPGARALVVCVELCTLHIQPSGQREALYGASFFGDGASACVITEAVGQGGVGHFLLDEPYSTLLPDSADQMAWELGDHGFDLYLSPEVPRLIARHIPGELDRMLGGKLPDWWAVHPGGKGIVDAVQQTFHLQDEQVAPSRNVLRRYGNLSSATILFVLEELRRTLNDSTSAEQQSGLAVAFGPGLTFEMLRMSYVPQAATLHAVDEQAGVVRA